MNTILKTIPLTDLTWSGSDKKTANVPAGNDFEFYPNLLPSFSQQYDKPEEFTIFYRDEFNVMRPLKCNYVSNGDTKYIFSYRKDNDVINLSVYKSDGHLEINVRNGKLEEPMDLNQVEFELTYTPPEYPTKVNIDPEEGATVDIPETVVEGETYTWTVNLTEGYGISDLYVTDSAEIYIEGQEVEGNTITFTCPSLPLEAGNEPKLVLWVVVSDTFTIDTTYGEHITYASSWSTGINVGDEFGFSSVVCEEGYTFSHIVVLNANDETEIARFNSMTCILEDSWPRSIVIVVEAKETPEPPTPGDGDLIFTTTFNRYAIVDVYVKEDSSAGVVNVRRLTEDDVDLDDTYETVLRATCTFRQDLIVGVEVEMNKPDNVAANYTVKSTKIFINGEEI